MSDDSLADAVAALWRQLAPAQLAAATSLEEAAARVEADPADAVAWSQVRDQAHRLAGTLGSFGQDEAGRVAQALEARVGGTVEPDVELRRAARALAVELRQRIERSIQP
ncbi:Hpt domain-containing protein [Egicoccus sp. AB-alg6-2]|uniref:Hpt domain-containing protein n=1 Tax=Egicoccus sp. AB-alg6-2 TaxID=3242692 RepID=UPI00359D3A4F